MEIKIADTELKEITSIFYRILIPRPIAWVSPKSKNDAEIVSFSAPFLFILLGDTIKIGGQVGAHGFFGT